MTTITYNIDGYIEITNCKLYVFSVEYSIADALNLIIQIEQLLQGKSATINAGPVTIQYNNVTNTLTYNVYPCMTRTCGEIMYDAARHSTAFKNWYSEICFKYAYKLFSINQLHTIITKIVACNVDVNTLLQYL